MGSKHGHVRRWPPAPGKMWCYLAGVPSLDTFLCKSIHWKRAGVCCGVLGVSVHPGSAPKLSE